MTKRYDEIEWLFGPRQDHDLRPSETDRFGPVTVVDPEDEIARLREDAAAWGFSLVPTAFHYDPARPWRMPPEPTKRVHPYSQREWSWKPRRDAPGGVLWEVGYVTAQGWRGVSYDHAIDGIADVLKRLPDGARVVSIRNQWSS